MRARNKMCLINEITLFFFFSVRAYFHFHQTFHIYAFKKINTSEIQFIRHVKPKLLTLSIFESNAENLIVYARHRAAVASSRLSANVEIVFDLFLLLLDQAGTLEEDGILVSFPHSTHSWISGQMCGLGVKPGGAGTGWSRRYCALCRLQALGNPLPELMRGVTEHRELPGRPLCVNFTYTKAILPTFLLDCIGFLCIIYQTWLKLTVK